MAGEWFDDQRGRTEEHMDKNQGGLFKLVDGLKPVDAGRLRTSSVGWPRKAIPEMIREVEKRRMLAAESRNRQLEMPTTDKSEPTKE